MTAKDEDNARRPRAEKLDRKLISGAQDRRETITLGMRRSTLLDPVIMGMSVMKLIIAANHFVVLKF